jgi:penicillin amidase
VNHVSKSQRIFAQAAADAGRRARRRLAHICGWIGVAALSGAALLVAAIWFLLSASLPILDGAIRVDGLEASARVEIDNRGVPLVLAGSRNDSYRALGFLHANDRLFQMDLMRRRSAGRLAEVFGASAIEQDKWHKVMGFEHVADAIFANLPTRQRDALHAYAEGVNAASRRALLAPWEFLVLGYRPEPWRAEDCLLVILGLYDRLAWSGNNERVATIIESTFSTRAAEFFFPSRDCETESLFGADIRHCHLDEPPVADFHPPPSPSRERDAGEPPGSGGSNAWAIAPSKSGRNRAILANDMHLDLLVPNIWYRADIAFGKKELTGITLPGTPLLISGSNRHIAWGFTNVSGDFSDLILLDQDSRDDNAYMTPNGPQPFRERTEIIHVRGAPSVSLRVQETIWGPVLPERLLAKRVAVRWTALDPTATDVTLLDLDDASSVNDALTVFNKAGGAALNAMVADDKGNIGWTYTGRIPIRAGYSGLTAKSWSDGTNRWQGYIPPDALPRIVNPTAGFIVSANQRMVGADYPYPISHHFDNGARAFRITEALAAKAGLDERDMLDLQLDTQAHVYRYYQRAAIDALTRKANEGDSAFRDELRRHIAAWDGRANSDSVGLAVLAELRRAMAGAVFGPLLGPCRTIDPTFDWRFYRETSLRRVLDARPMALLPKSWAYSDWDGFIATMAEQGARKLLERTNLGALAELSWAKMNVVQIRHPLSNALPWLATWLDMPNAPAPGCDVCVRWTGYGGGASERLVVSPGHEDDGLFHMPAGQSGHPLSKFYGDQHRDWLAGAATPLLKGRTTHRLELEPARPRDRREM